MIPRSEARHTVLASFTATRPTLSFANAVVASGAPGAPGRVRCHRGPDGTWSVLAAIDAGLGTELAAALGGTTREPTETAVAQLDEWPRVSAARLAVLCVLPAAPPATLRTAHILTSGRVSHNVLRRCLETGAQVSYQAVTHRAISGQEAEPALRIHLTATVGSLPVGAVAALGALPATHVFRPCDPGEHLLLDIRHRLPLPDATVAAGLPEGEVWFVGGALLGTRVLCTAGADQDATNLLVPEVAVPRPAPSQPVPGWFRPVQVRVVLDDQAPQRAAAVLLDDSQLGLLRTYLAYRRLAEEGLLLFGLGHHLLVEPGSLVETLPFGRPMWKSSAGPLFIEAGCDLLPPMPARAHRRVFGLDDGRVVAIWRHGSAAFEPRNGVPVWTQWLPARPEVSSGLSGAALELLERLSAAGLHQAPPAGQPAASPEPGEAARLELQGRYAEAARIMEDSGQWLQAAVLWEEALAHEKDELSQDPPEPP